MSSASSEKYLELAAKLAEHARQDYFIPNATKSAKFVSGVCLASTILGALFVPPIALIGGFWSLLSFGEIAATQAGGIHYQPLQNAIQQEGIVEKTLDGNYICYFCIYTKKDMIIFLEKHKVPADVSVIQDILYYEVIFNKDRIVSFKNLT